MVKVACRICPGHVLESEAKDGMSSGAKVDEILEYQL